MATKTTGLGSISEGRTDIFKIDPRKLAIKPGWNSRDMSDPANIEHVDSLAMSIAQVGVLEPLTVVWEEGKAFVINGHMRHAGCLRAIEHYKAELKTVPVMTEARYASEADKVLSQLVRNSGKPLSVIEQGVVFKRLLGLGWAQKDIAAKAGLTASRVNQILGLQAMPEAVKSMVVQGQVSPSLAQQVVKAEGTQAEQVLAAGIAKAQDQGLTKVKPEHVAPASAPKTISAAVIEAFEYADIDDDHPDFTIVKFPTEHWEVLRNLLKL